MSSAGNSKPIRVVAVIEAATVTGPAKNLIAFAAKARPEVQLSLVTYVRGDDSAFVQAARAAGLEVDLIRESGRFDRSVIRQLREIVERRAPEIVQTHNVKSHVVFKLSGLHQHHRWIGFHHGYTLPDFKQRLYDQLDRFTLPSVDALVTVCQPFARQMERIGVDRRKIRILHNSLAVPAQPAADEIGALRRRLSPEGEPLVLAVGRLSTEKGHADLLDSFARVPTPAKLVLVGDGPERGRLEQQAASLGIADRVIFEGHAANVRPYYFATDVLALPSHSEGSPNVVLEAMAMRLPVVASAVGGVPEIVSHEETGLLVPPRDRHAFAEALEEALKNRPAARRMADRAFEMVRAEFTPERYKERLVGVYRDALGVDLAALAEPRA